MTTGIEKQIKRDQNIIKLNSAKINTKCNVPKKIQRTNLKP